MPGSRAMPAGVGCFFAMPTSATGLQLRQWLEARMVSMVEVFLGAGLLRSDFHSLSSYAVMMQAMMLHRPLRSPMPAKGVSRQARTSDNQQRAVRKLLSVLCDVLGPVLSKRSSRSLPLVAIANIKTSLRLTSLTSEPRPKQRRHAMNKHSNREHSKHRQAWGASRLFRPWAPTFASWERLSSCRWP